MTNFISYLTLSLLNFFFKLILGCRSSTLIRKCPDNQGTNAAHFLLDFFNIQSKSIESICYLSGDDADPVKLASVYERFKKDLVDSPDKIKLLLATGPTTTLSTTKATAKTSSTTRISKVLHDYDMFSLPSSYELYGYDYDVEYSGSNEMRCSFFILIPFTLAIVFL